MPRAAEQSARVVIVGAGFGGLAAASGLARAPVDVTVIDRHNYHLFQPLLYQVATAALSPADIAEPIRVVLRHQQNATVLLDEVIGIDTAAAGSRPALTQPRATIIWSWRPGRNTPISATVTGRDWHRASNRSTTPP